MTGERGDVALEAMDVAIRDEFIDTMECNLYCRCGAPNDAVQKMASEILTLRARVQAAEGELIDWDTIKGCYGLVTDAMVEAFRKGYEQCETEQSDALTFTHAKGIAAGLREALDAARGVG